jgi:maltooligosyltrehalose trehalohydrolase
VPHRTVLVIAEDERNLATIVRPPEEGGWGCDAVWADDFHHHVRRLSAGDRDGYYEDFSGTIADLATTIRQGWFYRGQFSVHQGVPRGTDPAGVPLERMVVCLQNHDQIGNRPFGRRLNHQIDPALFRALSALLLFLPETPLLFMGQEWAASTRFLFFTDHNAELGRLVTKGRREEFSRFEAFSDPVIREGIPDPQAASTFEDSRLLWDERTEVSHAGILELYRRLLRLRRAEPALQRSERFEAVAVDEASLVVIRSSDDEMLLLVLCTGTSRRIDLNRWHSAATNQRWEILLTTEEPQFLESPDSGEVAPAVVREGSLAVIFSRPGAAILKGV